MRSTRDRTCQTEIALLPEYAARHEIARVQTQEIVLFKVRGETRDRTCQSWISYFFRVRGRTRARTCQNTIRTAPGVRG